MDSRADLRNSGKQIHIELYVKVNKTGEAKLLETFWLQPVSFSVLSF
jgi:hypothetical protein